MFATARRYLAQHAWQTFVLMGLFFFLFGVTSLNLFSILRANIELFLEHGVMVVQDGAGRQLFELVLFGYLSLGFYVLFKACEKILVDRLTAEEER